MYASLKEYDVPVEHRATVWADVTRPDNSTFVVAMPETDPGQFTGAYDTTISGVYRMRIRAIGSTLYGTPFQREQTATAVVSIGGNQPPTGGDDPVREFLCKVLSCIFRGKVLDDRMIERLRGRMQSASAPQATELITPRHPRGSSRLVWFSRLPWSRRCATPRAVGASSA